MLYFPHIPARISQSAAAKKPPPSSRRNTNHNLATIHPPHSPPNKGQKLPQRALDGLRVLDLTHHVAGPYCTKLLADFGAEVIKIERPSGDPTRRIPPFAHDEPHHERSLLFAYLNTGKKSVTLNLKTPTGKALFRQLLQDAHILVENFAPRVMPSLGIDYQTLAADNPALIMLSVSNFGQTGPYRNYKAADIIHYALGGLMYIFGSAEREPLKHALRQTQFKAGTNAATAALIAWYHRQFTGEGQHIDISIQECVASALRDTTSLYTYAGSTRQRQPAYTGDMPRSPVAADDGYIVPIHFGGAVDWNAVADFIDAPALKDDAFATPESRFANAQALHEALEAGMARWRKFDLMREAHKRRGHIYGVVHSPAEVLASEQYAARAYFANITHPVIGDAVYPGAPFIMSETPWQATAPAPLLGEHNKPILCDKLGLSLDDLNTLTASGDA